MTVVSKLKEALYLIADVYDVLMLPLRARLSLRKATALRPHIFDRHITFLQYHESQLRKYPCLLPINRIRMIRN